MSAQRAAALKVLRWMAILISLVLAVEVVRLGAVHGWFGVRQTICQVWLAVFVLMALLAPRIGARVMLAFSATAYPLLAVFILAPGLIHEPLDRPGEAERVGVHRRDSKFVYKHIPGVTAIHETEDYRVRYTIDEDGCRVTPDPERPLGRITLLGCSFTYGDGVEDDESFPYILGKRYWTRYKIKNRAVQGWGTTQAYMTLKEELARPGPPPRLVLYGWINHHTVRSYIREEHVVEQAMPEPWFEVEGGRPVLKGYVKPGEGLETSPELERKELELCMAMMREMHRICTRRSVPFLVLLYNTAEPSRPPSQLLDRHGVPYLDLTAVGKGQFYPRDRHPTSKWHAAIAKALGRSERIKRLRDRRPGPGD